VADVSPEWIYALNGRTELLPETTECSTLCFPQSSIGPVLAENWDWMKPTEDLAIIMRLRINKKDQPSRTIMMATEPGIIGKAGMNSDGVGVCLNLLIAKNLPKDGLPVHILLRAALDSKNLKEWQDRIESLPSHLRGTVNAIVAADASGDWVNYEFAGREIYRVSPRENNLCCQYRTNHFLSPTSLNDQSILPSSYSRYARLEELVAMNDIPLEEGKRNEGCEPSKKDGKEEILSHIRRLLFDRAREDLPILRKFVWDAKMAVDTGTICSIVMCLQERTLLATKGSPLHSPNFHSFTL